MITPYIVKLRLTSITVLECPFYIAIVCFVLLLLLSRCSSFDWRRNSRGNHSKEVHCWHSWLTYCRAREKNSKNQWTVDLWRLRIIAATILYLFPLSNILSSSICEIYILCLLKTKGHKLKPVKSDTMVAALSFCTDHPYPWLEPS